MDMVWSCNVGRGRWTTQRFTAVMSSPSTSPRRIAVVAVRQRDCDWICSRPHSFLKSCLSEYNIETETVNVDFTDQNPVSTKSAQFRISPFFVLRRCSGWNKVVVCSCVWLMFWNVLLFETIVNYTVLFFMGDEIAANHCVNVFHRSYITSATLYDNV